MAPEADERSSQRAISSIAVLPFTNVNADPETEYLSDGITDNIIDRLSRLPNLKVISHTAVFHYKGRETEARAIGRELGVEAVLNGRLIKRNDAVTINLELVDVRDNSRIWGEQYNRRLADLLAVQREIPIDISEKLRLRLSGESKERLTRTYTENTEAYQLYLKGRYSWEKWTLDGAKQAVGYFEEAIKKDPNYALAYAGLADVYLFGSAAGAGLPQQEAHRRGKEAATKALSLDPQLGEAHAALAGVLLYDDWDFAGAEREYKRAIELSPSYAEAHHQYSHLLILMGRINESFAESKKFLELDPVSKRPSVTSDITTFTRASTTRRYSNTKKTFSCTPTQLMVLRVSNSQMPTTRRECFSEAVEEYLKWFATLGFTPDQIGELRKAFARSGIKGFYRKLLEQSKAVPQAEQDEFSIAELHARLGEKDQAFEWLEKAYAERSDNLLRLKEELGFDNLRSDPRYADLLRRIGLPQSKEPWHNYLRLLQKRNNRMTMSSTLTRLPGQRHHPPSPQ